MKKVEERIISSNKRKELFLQTNKDNLANHLYGCIIRTASRIIGKFEPKRPNVSESTVVFLWRK